MGRRLSARLACIACLQFSGGAHAEQYSVFLAETARGTLEVANDNNGVRTELRYSDRFGANEIDSRFAVDSKGLLRHLEISGRDSYARAIAEQLRYRAGTVEWRSATDHGTAAVGAFYLPSEYNAEHLAALARALLASADRSLDILPAGRARLQFVGERTVGAAAGEKQIRLHLIHGLDVRAMPVWLDANNVLFAAGNERMSYVLQGYEPDRARLLEEQNAALLQQAMQVARDVRRQPDKPVVIRGARLFDAKTRTMRTDATVIVDGDIISAVCDSAEVSLPADAQVIDAAGRTLLPGLIDMHVHIDNPEDALLDLLAGVTTVRDMGGDREQLRALTDRFASGELAGPRVVRVGIIEGGSPQSAGAQTLIHTPAQARRAIDRFADEGYVQIKLYSSFKPELVPVAVQAAHARGLRVSGHVPAGMSMSDVVAAGFDEVHHANFWFLNFMGSDINAKTNTPVRFKAVAERGHELNLDAPDTQRFIELLRERGTQLDPTLVIYENFFTAKVGVPAPSVAEIAHRLPPIRLRRYLHSGLASNSSEAATYAASFQRMSQMLKRLHDAGLTLVPGTDDFFSMGLARELELYVAAGIAPKDVLYLATLGAAQVLNRDRQFGSIEPGKSADLILIDGDPTSDIGSVRNVELVMSGGAIYDPRALAVATGLR